MFCSTARRNLLGLNRLEIHTIEQGVPRTFFSNIVVLDSRVALRPGTAQHASPSNPQEKSAAASLSQQALRFLQLRFVFVRQQESLWICPRIPAGVIYDHA